MQKKKVKRFGAIDWLVSPTIQLLSLIVIKSQYSEQYGETKLLRSVFQINSFQSRNQNSKFNAKEIHFRSLVTDSLSNVALAPMVPSRDHPTGAQLLLPCTVRSNSLFCN